MAKKGQHLLRWKKSDTIGYRDGWRQP